MAGVKASRFGLVRERRLRIDRSVLKCATFDSFLRKKCGTWKGLAHECRKGGLATCYQLNNDLLRLDPSGNSAVCTR